MALILNKTDAHGFVSAFHQLELLSIDFKRKKLRYSIARYRNEASRAAGEESIKTINDEIEFSGAALATLRAATSVVTTFIFNHAKGNPANHGPLWSATDAADDTSDES